MGEVIIIGGTPGTGKTTIAKKLAEKINGIHVDISKLVERERIYRKVDYKRSKTKIADIKQLTRRIIKIIEETNKTLIIEGHYAEIIPKKYVKCAIILRLDPRKLEERLKARGWPREKVLENAQAELLDVCLIKLLRAYGKSIVREIDTTNKNIEEVILEIIDSIKNADKYRPGRINWLEKMEKEGTLENYLTKFSTIKS